MDSESLELVGKMLKQDQRAFLVYDVRQAFHLARRFGFSVALVDLDLKGNEGLSMMRQLRESSSDFPIIAISRILGVP
jgi:DNA-binding response OmpR family regulator